MNFDLLSTACSMLIENIKLHPVKLNLIFNEDIDYEDIKEEYLDNYSYEDIIDFDWDTLVKNKNYTKLYMYSLKTGNDDTRGGGCYDLKFTKEDFIWEKENKNGITLRDVVEGCYRLKGSKYDYWYEMFDGMLNETKKEKKLKNYYYKYLNKSFTLKYRVDFSYGS